MTDAQALGIMAAILQCADERKQHSSREFVIVEHADTYTERARELLAAAHRLHAAETAAPRRHSNFSVGEPEEADGA